jgi:hypothetical protein
MATRKLEEMGPRELAATAIMACGEEALLVWNEPQWVQRRRLGDPRADDDLLERACARVGMDAAQIRSVKECLATEPKLRELLAGTIASSAAAAGAAGTEAGRRRFWLGVVLLLVVAGLLCVAALVVINQYQQGHHAPTGGAAP